MFVRTCQECGYKQVNTSPAKYTNDRWRDVKCKNCKSPALDYGSDGWRLENGNLVKDQKDDENEAPMR